MPSCLDLTDRVAVVIGGTSGIGRALASGLADHGARVVPASRRSPNLPADVRDRASLDAFRDAVLERCGAVDILVNAAGYTSKQPTATMPEDQWSCLMDTNLTGVLRACQSFYGPLKESGRGRIINIVSLGSFLAFHEVAAYCASKAGLLSLTRSLACEWARDGISVNAIAPGVFPTEMNSEIVRDTAHGREILTRTPMRRFGNPEELVGA